MTNVPSRTLAELRAEKDAVTQAHAARLYVEQRQEDITEALRIRDRAIRALLKTHGASEVARLAGVSLSTVKLARGRP